MLEVVNTSALVVEQDGSGEVEDSRPIMIDVDHVSMSFNMANEQLNSLKEYAVALAKGKLFFEEFKALDDVSFQVRKGDVFGIMGTNGSGKSTILKIIAGVLEPTKGKCTVNGNIAPLIELGAGFDMDLSARENIYLNGALLGYSRDFINEHFDEIVEFAEVEKFLDMPLKNYSSGMVSRIAFAIATVIVPEILVVDEVLSVGDFMFQRKCENRITQLIEEYGVTVLIVSHSNDQIARLCNKAIWIEKGHERLQGDAKFVSHVYGGLGGRSGSCAAEKSVLSALESGFRLPWPVEGISVVEGENPESVNANMILGSFGADEVETLVLASSSSHANAVIANALASSLNAPVLPIGTSGLSDSVERVLYALKPSRLIVVDAGGHSSRAVNELRTLPWDFDSVTFGCEGGVFATSLEVFGYGLKRGYWGDSIALVGFCDNPESLCVAPFLYANCCPAVVMTEEEQLDELLLSRLKTEGVETLYAFGSFASKSVEKLDCPSGFDVVAMAADSPMRTCESLALFVSSKSLKAGGDVLIASASISQWPELLACGCYAAREGSVFLLVDERDLDSIAFCLDCARKMVSKGAEIKLIGGKSGLTEAGKRLFVSCLSGCNLA